MDDQVPRNVLIVEDDQGCMELLGDVMRDLGLTTIVAGSVEGALRVVASQPLSLIILDVMLGDGDGFQVLRAVRAEARTARTPIAMCTAAIFELQANDDLSDDPLSVLVVKPFHINSFVQVVGALLAS